MSKAVDEFSKAKQFISHPTVHQKPLYEILENYHQSRSKDEAIAFGTWLNGLSASQKCSVWSKDGQYNGLFQMDTEQLYDKWLLNKLNQDQ